MPLSSNAFVHPDQRCPGKLASYLANSPALRQIRRTIMRRLPFLVLESDVTDIVYCNWVIDVAAVRAWIPAGLELAEQDGKTIFTILTYRHHHFGPRSPKWLRSIFPSPLQSNWRLYLRPAIPLIRLENGSAAAGRNVLFIKNVFNQMAYVMATRLFSDALPSHLAHSFRHNHEGERITTLIKGGNGSAPDFYHVSEASPHRTLPEAFALFFDSWEMAVRYLCLQEGAISDVPDAEKLAYAHIDLPIDMATVQARTTLLSESAVPQAFLNEIAVQGQPFCIGVPQVRFSVLSESLIQNNASTKTNS